MTFQLLKGSTERQGIADALRFCFGWTPRVDPDDVAIGVKQRAAAVPFAQSGASSAIGSDIGSAVRLGILQKQGFGKTWRGVDRWVRVLGSYLRNPTPNKFSNSVRTTGVIIIDRPDEWSERRTLLQTAEEIPIMNDGRDSNLSTVSAVDRLRVDSDTNGKTTDTRSSVTKWSIMSIRYSAPYGCRAERRFDGRTHRNTPVHTDRRQQ